MEAHSSSFIHPMPPRRMSRYKTELKQAVDYRFIVPTHLVISPLSDRFTRRWCRHLRPRRWRGHFPSRRSTRARCGPSLLEERPSCSWGPLPWRTTKPSSQQFREPTRPLPTPGKQLRSATLHDDVSLQICPCGCCMAHICPPPCMMHSSVLPLLPVASVN